jgi:hypothetical protein
MHTVRKRNKALIVLVCRCLLSQIGWITLEIWFANLILNEAIELDCPGEALIRKNENGLTA